MKTLGKYNMSRNFVCTLIVVAGLVNVTFAQEQDYVLKEVLTIRNGKLRREGNVRGHLIYKDNNASIAPIEPDDYVVVGGEMAVGGGANVKLQKDRNEVWLNYNTTVRLTTDGIQLVEGEAYIQVRRGILSIFGSRLRPIQTGTEFYFKVNPAENEEFVYVFKGEVKAETIDGTETMPMSKKEAVQFSKSGELERVDLYEADIERIEQWRSDLNWLELSWLGRLVRLPARHPQIVIGAVAITTTAIVGYNIGREDSQLRVNVRF
jgi:hypothetical protein